MPMLYLLGENHHLPLFHMAKHLFWINETKNLRKSLKLDIWLIQNWILKSIQITSDFYMKTTYGAITQPFIRATMLKKHEC